MKNYFYGVGLALSLLSFGCGGGGGSSSTPVQPQAPTISSFSPTAGTVGTQVTITGSALTGASAVKFNGTSATTFSVSSDTQIKATVPTGASTGKISVTTSNGTATSTGNFTLVSGTTKTYWIQNIDAAGTFVQATFVRAYQDDHCNVWVRADDAASISTALLADYGTYFTQNSWVDDTTYVHMPTEFFGESGNRINLLFYTMYHDPKSSGEIAGYFFGVDFYTQAWLDANGYGKYKSNETNCLYINIDTATSSSNQSQATLFTHGTVTHEFQHLCNAQYFFFDPVGSTKTRDMDTWANEMCSVTMESVFANQFDNYYLPLYLNSSYNSDFQQGTCDFLQWRNDWQQYVTNSLVGTYLLSQVPEANRTNLFKSFLNHTEVEGTSSSTTLTSVEDLMAGLQDASLGWTPTGWTTVSDFTTETTHVRDNWAALFKGFGTGLTGTDTPYNTFIATLTTQTMKPACVSAAGGSFPLRPAGLLLGVTNVASLDSQVITDASATPSGKQTAYVVVFNGTLPSHTVLNDDTVTMETATTTIGSSQLETPSFMAMPQSKVVPFEAWRNRFVTPKLPQLPRAMSGLSMKAATAADRATIPGAGNTANGGSTTAGYNYCFYVQR